MIHNFYAFRLHIAPENVQITFGVNTGTGVQTIFGVAELIAPRWFDPTKTNIRIASDDYGVLKVNKINEFREKLMN